MHLINGIWIIKKEMGICLFNKTYGGKKLDPQLFSGFLSGIYTFSSQITESGGLEIMELEDIRLLYGTVSDLLFIIAATKDEDVDLVRNKITEISKVFLGKYSQYLVDWDCNTAVFDPFERDLDQIIKKMRHVDFIEVPIKLTQKKRLKLSDDEFQVLSLCDGKIPTWKIATKLNITEFKLMRTIRQLEKKKLIKRKMVMKI